MTFGGSINYHSYLLRLWRDGPAAPWRASLQNTINGERYAFGDVETLITFIRVGLENHAENRGLTGQVVQPPEQSTAAPQGDDVQT